jgi:hypothetical protein
MNARRVRAIASAATAAAVMVVWAASAFAQMTDQRRERPRGALETCRTASEADFSGAYTHRRSLVVGPLALVGAGRTPPFVLTSTGKDGFQKFPLLVRNGHRVTVELSMETRRSAGLAYGPLPEGENHLRDTHRVVTFIACRPGARPTSRADGQPVTFWSGSVYARSPRCIPLFVWVDNERSPRRAVIHLGVRTCT